MTREDYFAAHAPLEIPEWFEVEFNEAAPVYPDLSHLSPGNRSTVTLAGSEGYGESDMANGTAHLWPEVVKVKDYYAARSRYDEAKREARYFGWRWHYAAKMCETAPVSA